jgi:type I restriction enzyme M protein
LAKLVAPRPRERIADPACGSGSLLIKCGHEVGSADYALYGQENNGATWALAKMNMFLHDVSNARIDWGDTLKEPTLLEGDALMRFNVVVANFPFSLDKWGAEGAVKDRYKRFWRGIPPKSAGDYAFITHMIETTYTDPAQNGRVGVIAPHGVLFRGGAEGLIRRKLVEENLLDAVIGLPPNLFFGAGIPAVILIFKRKRTDDRVLFVDASGDFQSGTLQNRLRTEDIERILAAYRERKAAAKYAYLATFEEIKGHDFNLNIARYVDMYEPEDEIDVSTIQGEIAQLDGQLADVEARLTTYLIELGYGA